MDLISIETLSITFIIGAATAIFIGLILYLFWGLNIYNLKNYLCVSHSVSKSIKESEHHEANISCKTVANVTILAVLLTLGVFTETLSNNIEIPCSVKIINSTCKGIDSKNPYCEDILGYIHYAVAPKDFDHLIKEQVLKVDNRPTDLSKLFIEKKLFSYYLGDKKKDQEKFIFESKGLENFSERQELLRAFYYIAKDRVYREPTYSAELQKLSDKIQLTRSFITIILAFIVLGVFVNILKAPVFKKKLKNAGFSERLAKVKFPVLILVISEILLINIYGWIESGYDKRVFGYFLSLNIPDYKVELSKQPEKSAE